MPTPEQQLEAKRKRSNLIYTSDVLFSDIRGHFVRAFTKRDHKKMSYYDDKRKRIEAFVRHLKSMSDGALVQNYDSLLETLSKEFEGHVEIRRQRTAYSLLLFLVGLIFAFLIKNQFVLFGIQVSAPVVIFVITFIGLFVLNWYLKTHRPPRIAEVVHEHGLQEAKA